MSALGSRASGTPSGLPVPVESIASFSPALEKTLREVVPSEDPLDAADFDAVAYINGKFPDEASLGSNGSKLDVYLQRVQRRVVVLSDGITKEVREHSAQQSVTRRAITQANGSIVDLFGKIKAIKEKALQSEVMVHNICRDIKSLDYAKKHLHVTILALRNLHMLQSAVDQLVVMADERRYKETAQLFKAVGDLLTLFDKYKNVPKIAALAGKVDITKESLKVQIMQDFKLHLKLVGTDGEEPGSGERLQAACRVLDVLGQGAKPKLISWFVTQQLDPYNELFAPGREGGSLDKTERRYAWLRRALNAYSEQFSKVFMREWELPAILSHHFCLLSRSHLAELLDSDDALDVNVLISTIQKTQQLEREMEVKFRGVTAALEGTRYDGAALVQAKYANRGTARDSDLNFKGIITDCFKPHLGGLVQLERHNIKTLIDKLTTEEKWSPSEEDVTKKEFKRLMGSDELFLYIKKSIKRCSRLTTGEAFCNVFKEYQRGLTNYCTLLSSRLPRANFPPADPAQPHENMPMSTGEVIAACMVVNTAEYCNETLPALAVSVAKLIDAEFKAQVQLDSETEKFQVLVTTAVQTIANGTVAKLGRSLVAMQRMPWSTFEDVGDQSDYINDIGNILQQDVSPVAHMLSAAYHSFYLTQLVSAFIPKYVQSIFKCRRIGEMGAQQLALDAHALKTVLLHVPSVGKEELENKAAKGRRKRKGAGSRAFTRYVNKEMGRAEALLKTLVSPTERLIATFQALLPGESTEELAKLMSLRGLKRAESQTLIDNHNSTVSPEERVELPLANDNHFKRILALAAAGVQPMQRPAS